jgi:hypothetical protein
MAQCIWCGRKGFFLFVNKNKLCNNCQSSISFDVQQRLGGLLGMKKVTKFYKKVRS